MPASNATSRFSDRVENYVRYRPGYPLAAFEVLREECGLRPEQVIADIASGTGKWTQILLENGNTVLGVEPNPEMRQAGERLLAGFPKFTSVRGTAEATTLGDRSVDFVTAAQAAHWFDRLGSRQEFVRILKPDGWLVLLWNERLLDGTPFLGDYEQLLLTYATDYAEVRHERTTDAVNEFFEPAPYQERVFPLRQEFDYAGLEGRLLSSSYAPGEGHPKHEPMLRGLRKIFEEHSRNGSVSFEYKTRVYFGRIKTAGGGKKGIATETAKVHQGNMSQAKSFHMTPDEFRRYGHAVVDWIADYHSRIESFPVLSQVKPGEIRKSLPENPPAQGEPFEHLLKDVQQLILPGVTHWQSPNFFAYFPCNASGPGILGDLVSSGLGVQGMLWSTSPACTELETHVMDWLVGMLGLPEKFRSSSTGGGVIQDTASSAALCALLAARERATKYVSNKKGCDGKIVAYVSTQTHSSLQKAAMIAGIGVDNLRAIPVDENFAMKPDALAKQVEADRRAGLTPCFVCATVGTTSSNAMDPLEAIGEVCRNHNLWMHVDAAMSGTAMLCPEFRHLQKGVEFADSYNFNPHKWMFTNFDCNCFWVADRKALIETLSILPEYLRNQATESGAVIDYRDWHIQLGRRFRSMKLWFVIRHYGIEGLQHHVREHVRLARQLAEWILNDERFELAVPAPLNLVCFRHKQGDRANQTIMDRLNQSGDLFLTHTKLNGQLTLRLCIGQTNTEARHVEKAWERIREEAGKLESIS